ncbi:protein dopey-2 isoform X1 [Hypanus sabinus]|uniref:protein dopey-2 isoform X1 n=2 Tax=Hypanus sabinus TaxID=79690 RepID=UPI0028C47135|nr:protein dopey-2 isoform X1 [Hypanus sabinus]XP_059824838.1 protein dopey-2 isoform X1 [Hypanus sabinus]
MDQEELNLINDYRYRSYSATIDKALKNFESSSEWADLISSLGKLIKALQSSLKYSLLPKRLIISKRLAQCLHPALPIGVHLKALETYEVIFKIIGTKWLAKDLFFYSSGLFPLLGNAAMSVKPVLLGLYEKYYLPLQKSLNPSLQAFITGLLPGLEEGSEIYDRTDILLQKLVLVVGQEVFYGALWGSVIVSPSIRLPASLFIVSHINKTMQRKDQKYMFGSDPNLAVKGLCASVKDSNVLVQRNTLEILFYFFPLNTCLDPNKSVIPMTRAEMVYILSAALHTILRRDMSLNRRLYAWLLGTDLKGGMMTADTEISEDETKTYFDEHSKDLLVQALTKSLQEVIPESDQDHGPQVHLKPFRILISLLDKPDLGPQVIEDLLLEVIRAFYSICKLLLDLDVQSSQNESLILSKMKENKNVLEAIKTVNVLIGSLSTDFLWDYVTRLFEDCIRNRSQVMSQVAEEDASPPPTVEELCTLLVFLLEVIPLELYIEVQTQFLPQMLCHVVQCLMEHMESLNLQELTKILKMCCVTLSKIQLPAAFMDTEAGRTRETELDTRRPSESPSQEEAGETTSDGDHSPEDGTDSTYPPLPSEDSGIGLSVMPIERSQDASQPRVSSENVNVWRNNGSIQMTLRNTQGLLAHFTLKYIFGMKCWAQGEDEKAVTEGQKMWEKGQITMPQFKQMLSEFFSVRGPPLKVKSRQQGAFTPGDRGSGGESWDMDRMLQEVKEVTQECRLAFAAICQLLLDCSSFPVYVSFREIESLHSSALQFAGDADACLPLWLKSLMTLSCCISDCDVQNVAISTLLEIINRSHSLALVIEDKVKRYKTSEYKTFIEKLQMITAPPITQTTLKLIADNTNFYQRAANVLWNQLDKESREHHCACVELFYKLHCLAPSANLCEDIICQALLHKNKGIRLETLFRFSVLWHFTRDIQGNRTSFCTRSFDRCLFVVLDSLNCSDGAIGAAAQGWLVRALSLNDVSRILEPVFLLLLHPKTQRNSIQFLKKKVMGEDLRLLYNRVSAYPKAFSTLLEVAESSSEESFKTAYISSVDRDALWAEVEGEPDRLAHKPSLKKSTSHPASELPQGTLVEEGKDSSEHTESIDTSSGAVSSGVTSSASPPSPEHQDTTSATDDEGHSPPEKVTTDKLVNGDPLPNNQLMLVHTDSDRTQMSQSLSSDEEEIDLEMQLITREKVLKRQREKHTFVEALFKHILLYIQPYDSKRVLYAFSVLEAVLKTTPKEFIEALCSTLVDTSSSSQLNLIHNLLTRHQESLIGMSFYGKLPTPALPAIHRQSSLMELLTYLCLNFLRSYYPCQMRLSHKDLLGNRDVQVNSVQVLIRIVTQLIANAKSSDGKSLDVIRSWLTKCKVQEYVLLSLSASMYLSEKSYALSLAGSNDELIEEGLSEENLVNFGQDQIWSEHPLQIELLKLLQVLIVLEHHLGQTADDHESPSDLSKEWHKVMGFQMSITAMGYVQSQPITAQGMFVSAVVRALQPQYGYSIHPPWVSLVTLSLPYLGKSLGLVVAPFVAQVCRNLNDLVQQYEGDDKKSTASTTLKKENIPPDYPLTLLEGLTTISHYCLLDTLAQAKKSVTLSDSTSLKNAKNAILEELPLIIDSMSLLWGVVQREESQRKPTSLLNTTKGSSSVYFKSTKTLRQKILDLLNPFAAQMGIHLMAAVATVWNKRKSSKKVNQSKVLPVASEAQLTLVGLVQALETLNTDSILQLIREVVKKPPQTKGEEKPTLVDIPMLQFSFALLQRLYFADPQVVLPSLLYLLKESVSLNLAAPGHFLLLGILNDFMSRNPNLENKKDQRDLQEVAQKIIEAVGNVVGSSLEQTSWLSRNLEVKAGPQVYLEDANSDTVEDGSSPPPSTVVSTTVASLYSVQALTLLAELLAHLLDVIYRSDEKEKAVPLISRLLYYVFPYLKNHSVHNIPSFRAAAELLSSLSGYAYTKRAWKKEAFDLFMDPLFFQMDSSCINHWKSIIDHLLTHEKTMFKDLMSMQSSSLKLFANYEQKAMLLKRQAFAIFSGEVDQYHLYLPLIQERLTETLRVGMSPVVTAQMFLAFRVLLTRISPQHLTSLWPIMVTELVQVFIQLEEDLLEIVSNKVGQKSPSNHANGSCLQDLEQKELDMYLSACKFLDTALCFPQEAMPLFQMYRWAFVPEVDAEDCRPYLDIVESFHAYKPYTVRILDILDQNFGEVNCEEEITPSCVYESPLLTCRSVSSIRMLTHFFRVLCNVFKTQPNGTLGAPNAHHLQDLVSPTEPATDADVVLRRIEENIAFDFLEMATEH